MMQDKNDLPQLVQHISQHGTGVAAGVYINHAPKPEVSLNGETDWSQTASGQYSKIFYVSVIAPGEISGVKVIASGQGIESLEAIPRLPGLIQTGWSGKRDWGEFLTVQSLANWSGIRVIASQPFDLDIKFEILR